MTMQDLFSSPAALFAVPVLDVERAKRLYLSQFVHVGCGGAPVAYLGRSIGCTSCSFLGEPVNNGAPLVINLAKAKVFKSMVVK